MKKGKAQRVRRVSPITLRILAVNMAALLLLATGLLYTGQYEREMINSELRALQTQGRLLASALAGGGVRETVEGQPALVQDLSRHMLRQLVESDKLRVILFNKTGGLLLDSWQLQGPGGAIQIVELDPPGARRGLAETFSSFAGRVLDAFPTRSELRQFPTQLTGVETYPGVVEALNGERSAAAWYDEEGHILLSAALPVQSFKNVLGGVMVVRAGKNIEQAVRGVRLTVLQLFLGTLLTTILLSLYLSQTIASPLLRLAGAAQQVEQSLLLKDSIPDFSSRGDEIGILSSALRSMTTALSERVDAISNFAADVAHEIRNPLASLKSAVETLAVVEDPARQKKLLSIIEEDVDRVNRLITDISTASRMDAEVARAQKASFDIAALLENLVEVDSISLGLRDRLTLEVPRGRRFPVLGSEAQLSRVVHNIVRNAASFVTPEGRIALSIAAQDGKIVIHIDNDGPAIPENRLEAIFERFYSERPPEEKFGQHSGLGLSISRQIVRAHGGAIFARNLSDDAGTHRGVRFTIVLPEQAEGRI